MLLALYALAWNRAAPPPGFTNIEILPIVKATIGVAQDEDLIVSFAVFQSDGATPLSLAGISFVATVVAIPGGATVATLSTDTGEIVISGGGTNVLTMTDFASNKPWAPGAYAFRLRASDGVFTKDVFALSSITVGDPAPLTIAILKGAATRGVITPL